MHRMSIPFVEENDQTQARREHLEEIRKLVGNVYPNKFDRSEIVEPGREDGITALVEKFRAYEPKAAAGGRPAPEEIELANQQLNVITLRVAGRIASPPRVMGKAAFVHLSDGVERVQLYIRQADIVGVSNLSAGETVDGWKLFSLLDHGDFIGVEGYLFITKTGELSIHVQKLQFLTKALVPLPGKIVDVKAVSRELGVRYVLEGSVQRADNRVRITAQLVVGASAPRATSRRSRRPRQESH